jgi:cell wall-associated NlpC family hydrolase
MSPRNIKVYSDLIGIPYSESDCWGIARLFYKIELGIELNRYYDSAPNDIKIANQLIYSNMGDFEKVTSPNFGDIVLLNLYGIEAHIGIYLNEQQLLHTTRHSGCVIDRMDRWSRMVVGFYRVRKND